ncbi:hypothetical protein [Nocardioides sp. AE5]|uniref:hypothetical protein n=1 Tax=Nocardioides sp. AE5 TaxID=2962573 RepID=UPI0028824521|nr:hypothetical protein [Nocardioides sp. AE5]MDT0200973.1 hypothetical protein [Nocardioides sp. AE5]
MTTKNQPAPLTTTSGIAMIILGIATAQFVAPHFDGFVKGMAQGAGIALIILGVYFLASSFRKDAWLPSRERDDD